jgi:hypothetical protein
MRFEAKMITDTICVYSLLMRAKQETVFDWSLTANFSMSVSDSRYFVVTLINKVTDSISNLPNYVKYFASFNDIQLP